MGKRIRQAKLYILATALLLLMEQPVLWDLYRPSATASANASLPAGPFVALTFDDGPKPETTPRLLDGLSRRGVRCTFFVLGVQVEGNEDLLRRMANEGHQIGMHTAHHKALAGLGPADFSAEVDQLRFTLTALLGPDNYMLRPPYGMISHAVEDRAASPLILWSVDPEDWSDHDAARIAAHIVDNAQDGDVILLHDIYDASVDAALEAVDELMAKGYTFVTVEELFALRGVTPENGKVYRRLPPESGT